MTSVDFIVIGKPVQKGSITSWVPRRKDGSLVTRFPGGPPMVVSRDDTGDRGDSYAQAVTVAAADAMRRARLDVIRGRPIEVSIVFVVARGAGHYGTGRNAGVLKASAPTRPAKRPDVDKYARRVLDALSGIVYADDGQVVTLTASKVFGDPPRAEISVTVLPDQVGALAARQGVQQLALAG